MFSLKRLTVFVSNEYLKLNYARDLPGFVYDDIRAWLLRRLCDRYPGTRILIDCETPAYNFTFEFTLRDNDEPGWCLAAQIDAVKKTRAEIEQFIKDSFVVCPVGVDRG